MLLNCDKPSSTVEHRRSGELATKLPVMAKPQLCTGREDPSPHAVGRDFLAVAKKRGDKGG